MRSHISLLASFLILACGLPCSLANDPERTPEGGDSQQEAKCSTLSELGVDFGAAELGRFAELGLSDEQKKETLGVVRGRKPRIEGLCERMTAALKMKEDKPEEKLLKETELSAIMEQFKLVQGEIMNGLHAVLTKEQVAKLDAIKKLERQKELEKAKEKRPAAEATG